MERAPGRMQEHDVQAFTYELRGGLLPRLTASLAGCGGWLLDRRTLSTTAVELKMEIQLRGVLELYAALAAAGVELTRGGQQTLTALCVRMRHGRRIGEVVTIRLEIRFLEDVTLPSLLAASSTIV